MMTCNTNLCNGVRFRWAIRVFQVIFDDFCIRLQSRQGFKKVNNENLHTSDVSRTLSGLSSGIVDSFTKVLIQDTGHSHQRIKDKVRLLLTICIFRQRCVVELVPREA